MTITIGQLWKDNDPRMNGRVLLVYATDERYVYLQNVRRPSLTTRIMRKFFRPEGSYRTGFSLIE